MKSIFCKASLVGLLVVLLAGCAPSNYQYRETNYDGRIERGGVLQSLVYPTEIEEKILALDPEHISEKDVREILSRGPTPRIINVHGGIYPVHLAMESFSRFLVGMGYPETKIRNPRDGRYSYSAYTNSAKLAGLIAWYYEKEGIRVNLIGHSGGGIRVVKILHELAGRFSDKIAVWNPITEKSEDRFSIVDPITGATRPVVGLKVGYASAAVAGGLTMILPSHWSMIGKLRSIPDTVEHFTGFYKHFDLIGGTYLGLVTSANIYHPNGAAKVRNVKLPVGHGHVTVPVTAHLAEDKEIRDWINNYVPTDVPKLPLELEGNSTNIIWASDVWYSIKKQWALEAQRVIRARRNMNAGRKIPGQALSRDLRF